MTLTEPQRKMLKRAAAGRDGEAFVRRGQSKTAARLAQAGLVNTYMPNNYTVKVRITDLGRRTLAALERERES